MPAWASCGVAITALSTAACTALLSFAVARSAGPDTKDVWQESTKSAATHTAATRSTEERAIALEEVEVLGTVDSSTRGEVQKETEIYGSTGNPLNMLMKPSVYHWLYVSCRNMLDGVCSHMSAKTLKKVIIHAYTYVKRGQEIERERDRDKVMADIKW